VTLMPIESNFQRSLAYAPYIRGLKGPRKRRAGDAHADRVELADASGLESHIRGDDFPLSLILKQDQAGQQYRPRQEVPSTKILFRAGGKEGQARALGATAISRASIPLKGPVTTAFLTLLLYSSPTALSIFEIK
jgi:hypothetical protein